MDLIVRVRKYRISPELVITIENGSKRVHRVYHIGMEFRFVLTTMACQPRDISVCCIPQSPSFTYLKKRSKMRLKYI